VLLPLLLHRLPRQEFLLLELLLELALLLAQEFLHQHDRCH
jgi:hypothetical protein